MRLKQEELQNLAIRHDALTRQLKDREAQLAGNPSANSTEEKGDEEKVQDQATIDEVRARGGRGRFFVDAKPTQGLLLVGAKKKGAIELMDRFTS